MRSLSHIALQIDKARAKGAGSCSLPVPGLHYLGGGCYGAAYKHLASGRVLKVSYSLEDGTMDYIAAVARHCVKHGKPPHMAPMVYEFGQCGAYWYAVMEFVTPGGLYTSAADMRAAVWDIMKAAGGLRRGSWQDDDTYSYKPVGSLHDASYDLHSGNTGVTLDGREVIFDPFSAATRGVKRTPKRVQTKLQHGPSRGRWAH